MVQANPQTTPSSSAGSTGFNPTFDTVASNGDAQNIVAAAMAMLISQINRLNNGFKDAIMKVQENQVNAGFTEASAMESAGISSAVADGMQAAGGVAQGFGSTADIIQGQSLESDFKPKFENADQEIEEAEGQLQAREHEEDGADVVGDEDGEGQGALQGEEDKPTIDELRRNRSEKLRKREDLRSEKDSKQTELRNRSTRRQAAAQALQYTGQILPHLFQQIAQSESTIARNTGNLSNTAANNLQSSKKDINQTGQTAAQVGGSVYGYSVAAARRG